MAGHVLRSLAAHAWRWGVIEFYRDPGRSAEERGVLMASVGAVLSWLMFTVLLPAYLLWLVTGRGPLRPRHFTFTGYRRPMPADVKRRMEDDREALRRLTDPSAGRPGDG